MAYDQADQVTHFGVEPHLSRHRSDNFVFYFMIERGSFERVAQIGRLGIFREKGRQILANRLAGAMGGRDVGQRYCVSFGDRAQFTFLPSSATNEWNNLVSAWGVNS